MSKVNEEIWRLLDDGRYLDGIRDLLRVMPENPANRVLLRLMREETERRRARIEARLGELMPF